ncbi:MAG: cell envelope integrity protein CreD [Gammaproteobacteria bacterium]
MQINFDRQRNSVIVKVLFIGGLTLLLLIPMSMIEGIIGERMSLYAEARRDVANAWGAEQTIGAPILILPFQYTQERGNERVTVTDELYVLPTELEIVGDVQVQQRKRGIYEVPVYTTHLAISGQLAPPSLPQLARDHQDLVLLWGQASIALPLSDARAVKEPIRLQSAGASIEFQAGSARATGFGPQLIARYADLGLGALAAPQTFSFDLVLGGTGALRFLPLGDLTRVRITSNWPSPKFFGAYLPDEREVADAGFSASWRVLALGRGFASSWQRLDPAPTGIAESSFGAELITPIGVHEATLRAAKYAVLFIGLTFIAYFMFEVFSALRLHMLQYLLIGLANCVFYMLLLALAEQIPFVVAYAVSAFASSALISLYSGTVLGSMRRAIPVATLLASLYGYLYVTLRAEDLALIFGALGLFAVLAAFMYFTRRVDWHAVSFDHVER